MTIKQIIAERNKNFNDTQNAIKAAIKKWASKEVENLYARNYIIEQLKAEITELRRTLADADKGFNVALKREVANSKV